MLDQGTGKEVGLCDLKGRLGPLQRVWNRICPSSQRPEHLCRDVAPATRYAAACDGECWATGRLVRWRRPTVLLPLAPVWRGDTTRGAPHQVHTGTMRAGVQDRMPPSVRPSLREALDDRTCLLQKAPHLPLRMPQHSP